MKYIDADQLKTEIGRLRDEYTDIAINSHYGTVNANHVVDDLEQLLSFLDSLPEQPVSDHHEIEVEFRGEKVTISREFYRDGERNYSTGEQDDNAIWAALRAWCEKKGITPFELYPKQPEQPMEETPEPYTGVYDEAYLQEKITKATKSWEGVDVDKMLAECRGYEQPVEGLGCETNK